MMTEEGIAFCVGWGIYVALVGFILLLGWRKLRREKRKQMLEMSRSTRGGYY